MDNFTQICFLIAFLCRIMSFFTSNPLFLAVFQYLNNEAARDDCSEVDDTKSGDDEEEDEEEPMTKKVREVVKGTLLYCIYCGSEWKTSKSRLRHEIQCTHK